MKKVKGSKFLDAKRKKEPNINELMVTVNGKKVESTHKGCCMHHKLPFSTRPVGVPIKKFEGSYIVDGVCCSWSCAKAYIIENLFNSKYQKSLSLLTNMHIDFGFDGNINPAPDWRLLANFGGPMTPSDFEKGIDLLEVHTGYIMDPRQITSPKMYSSID